MKKIILASVAMLSLAACSYVPAGNVGVKVNLYGSEKGVDIQQVPPGRYWLGWNEELHIFPTFSQTRTWQANADGSLGESISFQDREGMNASADIGITYAIDPTKAAGIFQKYRKGIDEITDTYLRNMVRDALVKRASTQRLDYLYGPGKAELIENVQEDVRKQVVDIGIHVEKVYWIGAIRLPEQIVDRINQKNATDQMTLQRKAEVDQANAEAEKLIAETRGQAEKTKIERETTAAANLTQAKAEAEGNLARQEAEAKGLLAIATSEASAISLRGEAEARSLELKSKAEAEGIKARAQSITDNLIKYETARTWKGEVPSVVAGSNTFQYMDILKAAEQK